MKISIITVSYNSAETLEDTILSVIDQTYSEIEYIVIDGGSSDGTQDILRKHKAALSVCVSEPDRGIYDAMNKGLQLATGHVVGFLNADDVFANNQVVARIAQCFADHALEACYSDLIYVARNDLSKIVRYWKSCCCREALTTRGWCPPHLTFFARKSVYERYGKFDLSFDLASDFEILLRFLFVHRINAQYLPFVSVKMRMGGVTNKSLRNVVKQNIEIIKAYKKHGYSVSVPLFLATKIRTRLAQLLTGRAANGKT